MAAIVTLRRGSETDIPFIMATERLEGYGDLVGRWDADRHLDALRDGRHAYFIAECEGAPVGFAILRDWASAEQVTLVKRVAIARPGQGIGTAMMRALVARSVRPRPTPTACASAPFRTICVRAAPMRRSASRSKAWRAAAPSSRAEHRDELVLAILRPDWEARLRRG